MASVWLMASSTCSVRTQAGTQWQHMWQKLLVTDSQSAAAMQESQH
jgi:hypothetical protein